MMHMAGEPPRHGGAYDFGASDLFARGFAPGRAQFFAEGYARTPPSDLLFLQRSSSAPSCFPPVCTRG